MNYIKIFKECLNDGCYWRGLDYYFNLYDMNIFDRIIMYIIGFCWLFYRLVVSLGKFILVILTPLWIIPYLIFNIFRKEK